MSESSSAVGGPTAGHLETAVRAHHPSTLVLYEAQALDRELATERPFWRQLLYGTAAFVRHYPSVLLHSPGAIRALADGCFRTIQQADAVAFRIRAAALVVELCSAVCREANREGADRLDEAVPVTLSAILDQASGIQGLLFDREEMMPALMALGRGVVLVAEEASRPELWFTVLSETARAILGLIRQQLNGEPVYDGRWDETALANELVLEHLVPVRSERVHSDLAWLEKLARRLGREASSAVDVFLELSAYDRRDEREGAWKTWFEKLGRQAREGHLGRSGLQAIGTVLAEWIQGSEDRRFLGILARALNEVLPDMSLGKAGGEFGSIAGKLARAIAARLALEAGRGECDPPLDELQKAGATLSEKMLDTVCAPTTAPTTDRRPEWQEALELALQMRTGPVTGPPLSCADVDWMLLLATKHQAPAATLLASVFVDFSLFQFDVLCADPLSGLNRLLKHSWADDLIPLVRSVIRTAPLPPVLMNDRFSSAGCLPLATGMDEHGYLGELARRLREQPGPENLEDVDGVLHYWASGRSERLGDLIQQRTSGIPEELVGRDAHIRKLLEGLDRHAPAAGEPDSPCWIRLDRTWIDPVSIRKIAGFDGLDARAVEALVAVLRVRRSLGERYRSPGGGAISDMADEALFVQLEADLAARKELTSTFFGKPLSAPREPVQALEDFHFDLDKASRINASLSILGKRASAAEPELAGRMLAVMVRQARLSGIVLPPTPEGSADPDADLASLAETIQRKTEQLERHWRSLLQQPVARAASQLLQNPLTAPAPAVRRWLPEYGSDPRQFEGVLLDTLIENLMGEDGAWRSIDRFARHWLDRFKPDPQIRG